MGKGEEREKKGGEGKYELVLCFSEVIFIMEDGHHQPGNLS